MLLLAACCLAVCCCCCCQLLAACCVLAAPAWCSRVSFYETGFRVNAPVGNSDTHGAHTDPGRKWKLYYLLERGGDAVTKFYKEKGQPVVRDQSDELGTWNNIDELEIIEQVQWPMYQWVLINTMVIHSVENIQGYRCNFTISIRPQDLLNLYRR
jgi:hypothetical protein